MHIFFASMRRATALLLLLTIFSVRSYANLNAIDFTKVGYPKTLQPQIDQLIADQKMYAHWVPEWKEAVPKEDVITRLTTLYKELQKLPANIETDLLMGDIAHFLYNMDAKDSYQMSVDNYEAAKKIAPNDYRGYWFLGNHYALAGVSVKAIDSFKGALDHQPSPKTAGWFWSDYTNACILADMPATAAYAGRQASIVGGARSYAESVTQNYRKTLLHAPPADTALAANQMWYLKKVKDDKWKFTNYALGYKLTIDSTWNLRPTELKNGGAFALMVAPRIKSELGPEIGFSVMVYAKVAKPDETIDQFADNFTNRYANKKAMTFDVGEFKNCRAFEITDPKIYPQWGGSHMYAVMLERDRPEYPGMVLEEPAERRANGTGQVQYFRSSRAFSRFSGKMYYMVMIDSCEAINKETLAAFKEFLAKGLLIE